MGTLIKTSYPKIIINNKELAFPLFLGPMGVGVSGYGLVAAVTNEGGAGILSVVGMKKVWSLRLNRPVTNYEAIVLEIAAARALSPQGLIGVNVMMAVQIDFESSIRACVDSKVDFISIGAGLISNLPKIDYPHQTNIAVIVSSDRAAKIVLHRWKTNNWEALGYKLIALIVEGPKAGGHLGFSLEQIDSPEYQLEAILPSIIKIAKENGHLYVIAAGGIYTREDILDAIALGVDGVQMATRFLATVESDASYDYKMAIVNATKPEDIIVSSGSPCGLLFRVVVSSPMYQTFLRAGRLPHCDKGLLLRKDAAGHFTICPAKTDNLNFFCICNGLLASRGVNPLEEALYTAGTNAWRVKRISTAKEIMDELKGVI